MSNWFTRNFSSPATPIAEARHEIMAGWFGRHFEPHPTRQQAPARDAHTPGERDIHGNERGIDR